MQIYRWFYKLQVLLQVILQSNLQHDKGHRPWGQLHLSLHSNSSDRTETSPVTYIQSSDWESQKHRYTFWQSWNRHQLMFEKQTYEAVTDVLRNRHEQLSYDDTDLQSDLQPILHANLHSDLHTDLLADLQNNLHTNLQKSTGRSAGGATLVSPRQSIISSFCWSCSTSDLSIHKWMQWLILLELNKGPVLDWTDDNGLMEHFRKWKKKVEILFWGPLTNANDAVKCNYIIYWSGETGMELVDKWETEKITDDQSQQHCKIFQIVWGAHLSKI